MMHRHEKSDSVIVAAKPVNKVARTAVRIELDNNTVERAIRPIALGRKNHLFAGSDGGAERWRWSPP